MTKVLEETCNMKPPIFFVHLKLFGYDFYLDKCLEITCLSNPDSHVFLITMNETVRDYTETLGINNLFVVLLSEEQVESILRPLDEVMFHDGINSRSFELICFGRHMLIKHAFEQLGLGENTDTYYYCDSDSAAFTPLHVVFPKDIQAGAVYTKNKKRTYFAEWSKEALETFCSTALLRSFFEEARYNGVRTNDMHYLRWAVNNGHIIHEKALDADEGGVVHIDPIRHFIAIHALFVKAKGAGFSEPSFQKHFYDLPGGIWLEDDFLANFGSHDFMEGLFEGRVNEDGRAITMYLKIQELKGCIEKVEASWERPFERNRAMLDLEKIQGELVEVGPVHFQGAGKCLSVLYHKYWKELRQRLLTVSA